jgi:glycosyltransferase involved in cell wall biosynthesis
MRVLLVHSFLYPGHGGDSVYTLRLARLLEAHGHEVGSFGMRDARNAPQRFSRHEVPPIDYEQLRSRRSAAGGLRVLARAIYSPAARRRLGALLDEWRPDVAHLQSIHYHLTTSILRELRARRIPVVWTQHNLALVCCNYMLSGGTICERCRPARYWSPILTRCKKGSLAASTVGALQLAADRLSGVYACVRRFVAISGFYKRKLVEFGFDAGRIAVVPNFYEAPGPEEESGTGDYLLYFGRLSPEKGVATLLEALAAVPEARLRIAGDGPERARLETLSRAAAPGRVEFLGRLEGAELGHVVRGSRLTVTPSIWYENFPNTVVESFVRGRPVVGAAIGGIPELVQDGVTGLLFAPGDAADLAAKLRHALRSSDLDAMGSRARGFALRELDPELHYRRLAALYGEAISESLAAGRKRAAS